MITNIFIATITAYCACTKCCGPNAKGIAANNKPVVAGVTVAGPRQFPLGSDVVISGLTNNFKLNDRLAPRYDNRIDIYMSRHSDARAWGIQKRQVTIIYLDNAQLAKRKQNQKTTKTNQNEPTRTSP